MILQRKQQRKEEEEKKTGENHRTFLFLTIPTHKSDHSTKWNRNKQTQLHNNMYEYKFNKIPLMKCVLK